MYFPSGIGSVKRDLNDSLMFSRIFAFVFGIVSDKKEDRNRRRGVIRIRPAYMNTSIMKPTVNPTIEIANRYPRNTRILTDI